MFSSHKVIASVRLILRIAVCIVFIYSIGLAAQSCPTSCPTGSDCDIYNNGVGASDCPLGFTPHGSDPECYWRNPDKCRFGTTNFGCGSYKYSGGCCYEVISPILVDVDGSGFSLTDAANGILFDFFGDGDLLQISWTSTSSSNAWLVLDRSENGLIDNGTELFGNATPQPSPPPGQLKNGFLALAEYDKPENGGNGDGIIDKRDAIYTRLRLWQDKNHDGVSTPSELKTLPELGVAGISLDYKDSPRRDEFGNQFYYRAKILREDGSHDGRWAYDVFLISGSKK